MFVCVRPLSPTLCTVQRLFLLRESISSDDELSDRQWFWNSDLRVRACEWSTNEVGVERALSCNCLDSTRSRSMEHCLVGAIVNGGDLVIAQSYGDLEFARPSCH